MLLEIIVIKKYSDSGVMNWWIVLAQEVFVTMPHISVTNHCSRVCQKESIYNKYNVRKEVGNHLLYFSLFFFSFFSYLLFSPLLLSSSLVTKQHKTFGAFIERFSPCMTKGIITCSRAMEKQLSTIIKRQDSMMAKIETLCSSLHQHADFVETMQKSLAIQ